MEAPCEGATSRQAGGRSHVDEGIADMATQIGRTLQIFSSYITRQIQSTMEEAINNEIARRIKEEVSTVVRDVVVDLVKAEVISVVQGEFEKRFPQPQVDQPNVPPNANRAAVAAENPSKDPYTYENFSVCKPPEYHGDTNPIVTTRWISDIEGSFRITKCPPELKTTYGSSMLKGAAKQWWDEQKAVKGEEKMMGLEWPDFKKEFFDFFLPEADLARLRTEHSYPSNKKFKGTCQEGGEGSSADGIRIYTRRKRQNMCNSDDEFSGSGSFGEGSSADGMTIYTRRKHQKMCNSDDEFNDKFVRKPRATEANCASNCQVCGKKADIRNCLVCFSCEAIYHISCTELIVTQIPPKSWYCASCVSDGMGSPHDNCVACEKLKAASTSLVNGTLAIDQSQDVPNGVLADLHNVSNESQGPKICFICKTEVNSGDKFRACGHSLCAHKFYHYKCLTYRQLGVSGPCWYCPSCLCRRCLVDKDDDQIVLCYGCDQAYHFYCTTPRLHSIPTGSWFCGTCDRDLKRIRTMKRMYESMQKKLKVVDESEQAEQEAVGVVNESENTTKSGGGLDMLLTAAKTLSHQETMDLDALRNTI